MEQYFPWMGDNSGGGGLWCQASVRQAENLEDVQGGSGDLSKWEGGEAGSRLGREVVHLLSIPLDSQPSSGQ